jgi:FkbM family methyltransferase
MRNEVFKSLVLKSALLTGLLRQLRILHMFYLVREPHEADFWFLADPRYKNGFLLDLGGNIGNSAISAYKVQPSLRVFSIEANPACGGSLTMTRRLLGHQFDFRLIGVGADVGEMDFYVPVRSSRMLLEEGTFELSTLDSPASIARMGQRGIDYQISTMRIPLTTVDALNLQPNVIKMDLQGLEMQALKGMRETIERCWPSFMIEIGEHHEEVQEFLQGMGYQPYHWGGKSLQMGTSAQTLNAIFIRH